jgi:hypothetical protein
MRLLPVFPFLSSARSPTLGGSRHFSLTLCLSILTHKRGLTTCALRYVLLMVVPNLLFQTEIRSMPMFNVSPPLVEMCAITERSLYMFTGTWCDTGYRNPIAMCYPMGNA